MSDKAGLSRRAKFLTFLLALVVTAALGTIFAFQYAPDTIHLAVGQAAPKTILASDRITFVSRTLTQEAQDQAAASVAEVYDPPDANRARDQVRLAARVLAFVNTVHSDPYSSPALKTAWIQAVPNVGVDADIISRTLALDVDSFSRVISETLYVLDQAMRDEIRQGALTSAYEKLPSRVSLALPEEQADLVTHWARAFIVPNSYYNAGVTATAREQARANVSAVYHTIEKGEAIVREGEVATPLTMEALEAAGYLRETGDWRNWISPVLLAVLLVALGAAFVANVRPALLRQPATLVLLAVLLVFFAGGARVVIPERSILSYLYPVAAAVMLVAVLVDAQVAVGLAVLLAVSVGYISQGSLELTIFVLAGGLVAAVSLGRVERISAFLVSGMAVGVANALAVSIFRLAPRDYDWPTLGLLLLAGTGNGLLAGLLALGSLSIFGRIFGITTTLELVDLARPTHPLIQKLIREAPGTYHHSLIVSNLAEQAAQRIGADALLVRVAAYYHDIGKTANPLYFIENQMDGVNIHDALDPRTSAGFIIQHVPDGLALAKKHRLPARIRDFIAQHHGMTLAAYFYRKATIAASGTRVDENEFRYPGPKPRTREAAIFMLADGVEATARAERPGSPEAIREIIERIIGARLGDGQLDEADLTLRELDQVKEAFFDIMQGIFHPRVKYPEPTEMEKKRRLASLVLPPEPVESDR